MPIKVQNDLPEKLSDIYRHRVLHRKKMLMRGMDDLFYVPQSRYTGIDEAAVRADPELYVVADSEEAGSYLILACSSRQIFVTGHSEYDRYDLDKLRPVERTAIAAPAAKSPAM